MKRTLYILICLQLSVVSFIQGQSYIGPSIGANFVQMVDFMRQTHMRLGGGGELGLVYEWQRDHFVLRTGLQYALQCPSLAVDSQWLAQEMLDTRGVTMTYRGFLDERTDRMTLHQLTAPLMIGGTWSGFYLFAGAKFCVSLASTASVQAQLKTSGDYQGRYYEWFEDMPNHGYHDFEPVAAKHALSLKRFDVRLAAEIGYSFALNPYSGLKLPPLLRIGLFAEYGLINMLSSTNTQPRTEADWTQYLQVNMTHIYASEESNKAQAKILVYGIRFTLLFPISPTREGGYKCYCL